MFKVSALTAPALRSLSAQTSRASTLPCELAVEMRVLAADASEPTMFMEDWFLGPALSHLRGNQDICLTHIRDDHGNLVGLIPIYITSKYGRVPAAHVANWIHFQCFMGSPLVRAGDEVSFWYELITHLDRQSWARGFLSVASLSEGGPLHNGLIKASEILGRPCPTVHRYERAALSSDLNPNAYLDRNIRPKKRKELRRLANRLADSGRVTFSVLDRFELIERWCDDFLTLEAAGWKGERGAALGNTPHTTAFFRSIIAGAYRANRLDFQRLSLDDNAIAMLVNFRTPPGSWSFKIAYDEQYARFSPGVLIELENLPRVLSDPEIDWMDSCAVHDHPMINSLWGERRTIIQVSVRLSGTVRGLTYRACRAAEISSAWLRNLRKPPHD